MFAILAAGGLYSTASDLTRLGIEINAGTQGKKTRTLSKQSVDAMLTPRVSMGGESMGLGLFLYLKDSKIVYAKHGGHNPGFHALLVMLPETGQGVAIMTNGEGGSGLLTEILRGIGTSHAWPKTPGFQPHTIDEHAITAEVASLLAGEYVIASAPNHLVKIRADGAKLYMQSPGAKELRIYAVKPNKFYETTGPVQLSFGVGTDGKPNGKLVFRTSLARVEATRREKR